MTAFFYNLAALALIVALGLLVRYLVKRFPPPDWTDQP